MLRGETKQRTGQELVIGLKSHSRYCLLIYYKKKIILIDQKNTIYKTNGLPCFVEGLQPCR
jgi:hypothetical protein